MPTNSLIPALPYAADAVMIFRTAAEHVRDGDVVTAGVLLDSLNEQLLRAHFNDAMSEWDRRNKLAASPMASGIDKDLRNVGRMPNDAGAREVFQRDGWRCRWCTTPVISLDALKRMAERCPEHFRHSQRNDDCHGLTLCSAASLDHVVPHAGGGDNEANNLVTACWPCQFGRGSDPIERLDLNDPRDRPPTVGDWDGCAWFR